jgi:hypothetical protein
MPTLLTILSTASAFHAQGVDDGDMISDSHAPHESQISCVGIKIGGAANPGCQANNIYQHPFIKILY